MTRALVLVLGTLSLVLACIPAADPEDGCGAAGLLGLVGQPGAVAEQTDFGDRPVRMLPPDAIVTLDYRPERLNIYLDEAGLISDVQCG